MHEGNKKIRELSTENFNWGTSRPGESCATVSFAAPEAG